MGQAWDADLSSLVHHADLTIAFVVDEKTEEAPGRNFSSLGW
jgi:hypothetical protein